MAGRSAQQAPELFGPQHLLVVNSPLGKLWIESDGERIVRLSFSALGRPRGQQLKVLKDAARQLDQYFKGKRKKFDLPLSQVGSPFRRKVWKELHAVTYGRVKSYQEIAERTGGNARSVGGACAWNPLPILVPCHRVLTSEGLLTGYQGGIWRKQWLLQHEGVLPPDEGPQRKRGS